MRENVKERYGRTVPNRSFVDNLVLKEEFECEFYDTVTIERRSDLTPRGLVDVRPGGLEYGMVEQIENLPAEFESLGFRDVNLLNDR